MSRAARLARTLVELADTLVDDFEVVELLTNQLGRYPDLEQRWHVFSDERRRSRARAWLGEHGYRPTLPPVV